MSNIKVGTGVAIGAVVFYTLVFFSNAFALQNSAVGKRAIDVENRVAAIVDAGAVRR